MAEESRLGRGVIQTGWVLKQIMDAGVRMFFYVEDRRWSTWPIRGRTWPWLTDWHGALTRHLLQARPILKKFLEGRLIFDPFEDAAAGVRGYEIWGQASYGRLLAEIVAVPNLSSQIGAGLGQSGRSEDVPAVVEVPV